MCDCKVKVFIDNERTEVRNSVFISIINALYALIDVNEYDITIKRYDVKLKVIYLESKSKNDMDEKCKNEWKALIYYKIFENLSDIYYVLEDNCTVRSAECAYKFYFDGDYL